MSAERWALVTAKSFGRAKSRLASSLDAAARARLARAMFERVVGAARESAAFERLVVLTDDARVAALARRLGAVARLDPPGRPPLRAIVDAGLADAAASGARSAVVLMSDLPRVEARDLRRVDAALARFDVVLAPDVHGTGTNALGLRLAPRARPMPTAFGSGTSLAAHVDAAVAAALRYKLLRSARLAYDVDVAADLAPASPLVRCSRRSDAGGTARRA